MRDSSGRQAVAAFLGGIAIMAAALGAFLAFAGTGGPDGPDGTSRPVPATRPAGRPNCLNPAACREPTDEFEAAYSDSRACEGTALRVCLVTLGYVPKDVVDHLVAYYADEYALKLHVLPAVSLQPGFSAGRRGQLEARTLIAAYADAYPAYYNDSRVVLIGLTSIDIYTADRPQWQWFFGSSGGGRAIISVFRMDPTNWGLRANDDLRNRRVRTLMNKYIALNYYRLPLSDDPNSVLYGSIGSVADLDRIDEEIPVPSRVARATPESDTRYATVGVEIARLYRDLMQEAKELLDLRLPAAELLNQLSSIESGYRSRLAALGCNTDRMTDQQRVGVFNAAVKYTDEHGSADASWFGAAEAYQADPRIAQKLDAIDQLALVALPGATGGKRAVQTACP
jgi:predicted Zn-dependent protease